MYKVKVVPRSTPRVQISDFGPSKTKQSFKEDVDINNIVKRFLKTGQFAPSAFRSVPGESADLSSANDFKESMNIVLRGEQAFNALPATTRYFFHNNPSQFLEFMADPKNKDKAIELKLMDPPKVIVEPKPVKVEVINSAAPAPIDDKK